MKIEKQFNKRAADLVEVQLPTIAAHSGLCLGIKATFYRVAEDSDRSTIAMHMTADEALLLAVQLIAAARAA